MERVTKISHAGKEIVFIDFSNIDILHKEELHDTVAAAKGVVKTYAPETALTLVNFSGLRFSSEFVSALKELAEHNKPYVKAGAALGVAGLQKILFDGVMRITSRNLPIMESKEEALEWLVQQ